MRSFLTNLFAVKAERGLDQAVRMLVEFDPQGATEAQLRTMSEHLNDLGVRVAQAETATAREQREADEIIRLRDQRKDALAKLEARLTAGESVQDSIEKLLTLIEGMAADIQREVEEARLAREFLSDLKAAYKEAGDKLKTAHSRLKIAQRDMERSKLAKDRALSQADAAEVAAGLKRVTSGLDVALNAMSATAAKNSAEASSALAKASILRPSDVEKDDPNIAAAMSDPKPAMTLEERIARAKAA